MVRRRSQSDPSVEHGGSLRQEGLRPATSHRQSPTSLRSQAGPSSRPTGVCGCSCCGLLATGAWIPVQPNSCLQRHTTCNLAMTVPMATEDSATGLVLRCAGACASELPGRKPKSFKAPTVASDDAGNGVTATVDKETGKNKVWVQRVNSKGAHFKEPGKARDEDEAGPSGLAAARYPKHDCKEILYEEDIDDDISTGQLFSGTASSEHRYLRHSRNNGKYTEADVSSDSENLFCEDCDQDYPGDCPVHGPLTHIEDTPVPLGNPQRANKTVPDCLVIRRSSIKGAQFGVFAVKAVPKRVCFGPFEGVRVDSLDKGNGYTWQVQDMGRSFLVDARPLDKSNWMRYVNCAPSEDEQNVVAFERAGAIYYRTRRQIEAYEELLVWYGASFATELGLVGDRKAAEDKENAGHPRQQRGTFPCETCGVVFLSREIHDQHRRQKHAEKPPGKYRCSQCTYSSDNSFNVTRHERTHTGERPFVCHLCRKGFTQAGDLKRHLRAVHAKEKPHECDVCGQRFTQSSHLAQHRRLVHTRDGPSFACPQCWRGFALKSDLDRHLLTHTGERPYACAACGMRFSQIGTMKRHKMVVHERRYPHQCQHCGKGCLDLSELRKHLRSKHWGEGEGAAGEGEE